MVELTELKPQWKNRGKAIRYLLVYLCALIATIVVASVCLAILVKFGFYIFTFLLSLVILSFALIIGLVSAWIFGNRFETKDYFNLLKDVIPNLKKDDDTNT